MLVSVEELMFREIAPMHAYELNKSIAKQTKSGVLTKCQVGSTVVIN